MAKLTLTDTAAGYSSSTVINANNALVEAAIENTISRDGTSPNTMSANLDMNSNSIVNVTDGTNNQDAVTVAQLNAAATNSIASCAGANVTIADSGGYYDNSTAEGCLAEAGAATQTKIKTANQSVISSTTYVADTHLAGYVLEAGEFYRVSGLLIVDQEGGDFKLKVVATNGSITGYLLLAAVVDGSTLLTTNYTGSEITGMVWTDASFGYVTISGYIQNSTATAVHFEWAQNTSDVDATTVRIGSAVTLMRNR